MKALMMMITIMMRMRIRRAERQKQALQTDLSYFGIVAPSSLIITPPILPNILSGHP